MPASVSIIVDGVTYNLSTNPATPTRIKLPSTASNVQVSVPTTTFPSTSNGGGYAFRGYNDGVNEEWSAIAGCTGVDGEDFCIESTTNTQNFTPTTKTILQVLKENADGKIAGMYYTINKCNTNKLYSLPIEGYYEVDYIPDPIINVDITGDITAKNCVSSTYTGLDINNPIPVSVTITDENSNSEIEALIAWFSKDNSVPTLVNITGTYTQSNTNDFGIMIRKNAGSWNSPLIYSTNTDNTWRLLRPATDKLAVQSLTITEGANVSISFGLEFKPTADNPSGLYNVYGTAIDSYMINSNVVDQSRIQDLFDWGIDLVNPTVNDITQTVNDVNSVYLDWSITDNESSILRTVINGYRTGGTISNDLEMFLPPDYTTSKGTVAPTPIPDEALIGMFDDTNAWRFLNTSSQRDLINVGENEGGMVNTYVTAYDMGCNTNAQYEDINLNPWMTAKGGTIYSTSGITNAAKDVAGLPALEDVFVKLTSEELDTGTELISARNNILPTLLHPELKAVQALSIYDSNDRKSYWFDHFKEKLATDKSPNAKKIEALNLNCPSGICYLYTTENITIDGYNCTSKILVMSEGNITINPDITSSSTSTGCIFVAKGNIIIGAGTYKTGVNTNVHYDYIDAYLMAQGQIIFSLVDTDKSVRDGIEINGGMVAFGNEVTSGSAINVLRNLKLLNVSNPTVVLNYDYKYPNIATQFFGVEAPIYKQEIGFKSF
ncbi:MAG: hypothetical protein UR61_C0011G0004 [candidate division WS6 bacterium GW2011_GWE1_34_7]|uniref:Uncharacterized protein n=2 Tax=Candidatus Dojkabacteria TaxID=74243 RepID=A0A0G0DRY9_9BACT|nr:MAG: hypothetical protein UR61_C0011G0004 [candidate division WS6 bacterium GW2011_GWE1_34_7]KKP78217.1 MAG: hypothetical protein UR73_C0002G0012 [candidate division WS6 bacterium GW2011_GWF1_35_23]